MIATKSSIGSRRASTMWKMCRRGRSSGLSERPATGSRRPPSPRRERKNFLRTAVGSPPSSTQPAPEACSLSFGVSGSRSRPRSPTTRSARATASPSSTRLRAPTSPSSSPSPRRPRPSSTSSMAKIPVPPSGCASCRRTSARQGRSRSASRSSSAFTSSTRNSRYRRRRSSNRKSTTSELVALAWRPVSASSGTPTTESSTW
mmetsp:Transcript_51499/g.130114  ORF Transcript_51499/g.130114 Transcript_51499/m.130114 type:complete len:203 (+) Transcript_51499:896-1504(+)